MMFAEQIRAARKSLGLKIYEVSDQIGVDRVTLYAYEHGKTIPRLNIAVKMAKIYGIDLNSVKFEEQPEPRLDGQLLLPGVEIGLSNGV